MLEYPKNRKISELLAMNIREIYRTHRKWSLNIKCFLICYLTASHLTDFTKSDMTLKFYQKSEKGFVEVSKNNRSYIIPIFDNYEAWLWGFIFDNYLINRITIFKKPYITVSMNFKKVAKGLAKTIKNTERTDYLISSRDLRLLRLHSFQDDYGLNPLDYYYILGLDTRPLKNVFKELYDPVKGQEKVLSFGISGTEEFD